MMSLVAYDGSSDSEEDCDNESLTTVPIIKDSNPIASTMKTTSATTTTATHPEQIKQINGLYENGTNAISDDEDEIIINKNIVQQQPLPNKRQLNLPPPSSSSSSSAINNQMFLPLPNEDKPLVFKNLPTPKSITTNLNALNIEEADDEFLRKKAIAIEKPQPKAKQPIQILIPTLKELDDDVKPKGRLATVQPNTSKKSCSLFNLLPKPKGSAILASAATTSKSTSTSSLDSKKNTFLIPDSVKNKQKTVKSTITQSTNRTTTKDKSKLIENHSDNEDEDDDNEEFADFFSLNSKPDDVQLPEISQQEINAMIVKKQTQMSQASNKYVNLLNNSGSKSELINFNNEEDVISNVGHDTIAFDQQQHQQSQLPPQQLQQEQMNQEVLNALCGSSQAKRTKFNDINIVDVSMDDILPKREEWLRTQIQHATGFNQPQSFAPIDMDLQPGTKRKHQITYLAHQAKANEDALQATWANNRHARRQTQSKYGF